MKKLKNNFCENRQKKENIQKKIARLHKKCYHEQEDKNKNEKSGIESKISRKLINKTN